MVRLIKFMSYLFQLNPLERKPKLNEFFYIHKFQRDNVSDLASLLLIREIDALIGPPLTSTNLEFVPDRLYSYDKRYFNELGIYVRDIPRFGDNRHAHQLTPRHGLSYSDALRKYIEVKDTYPDPILDRLIDICRINKIDI